MTCGGGRRVRRRTCVRNSVAVQCSGRPVDVQKCGKAPCPGSPTVCCKNHKYPSAFVPCLCFFINLSTAKCQHMCSEGRPSEDCSRCVCNTHVLYGEVHSVTGVPVAGAQVALASQPKVILARTNAKGQFRLTGICSSSATLISISKDKFAPIAIPSSSNATGLSWVRTTLKSAGKYS